MKKNLLSLLLASVLATTSLAGCGKNDSNTPSTANDTQQASKTSTKEETKEEAEHEDAQCKTPEDALNGYIDALISGDKEKAYTYMYKDSVEFMYDSFESFSNYGYFPLNNELDTIKNLENEGYKYEENEYQSTDIVKTYAIDDSYTITVVNKENNWLISFEKTVDVFEAVPSIEADKLAKEYAEKHDFFCVPYKYAKDSSGNLKIAAVLYNKTDKDINTDKFILTTSEDSYENKFKITMGPKEYHYAYMSFNNAAKGKLEKLSIQYSDLETLDIPLTDVVPFMNKEIDSKENTSNNTEVKHINTSLNLSLVQFEQELNGFIKGYNEKYKTSFEINKITEDNSILFRVGDNLFIGGEINKEKNELKTLGIAINAKQTKTDNNEDITLYPFLCSLGILSVDSSLTLENIPNTIKEIMSNKSLVLNGIKYNYKADEKLKLIEISKE